MGDYQSLGSLNLWTRSTDLRSECMMRWALGRLFEPDADAGYFHSGTAAHAAFQFALEHEPSLEEAQEFARLELAKLLAESAAKNREVRWTKKRPYEDAYSTMNKLIERFYQSVLPGDKQLDEYKGASVVATEFTTEAYTTQFPIITEVDAVFRRIEPADDEVEFAIVDWKTGSTAKADDLQLWLYNYALRHTEGSPLYGVPAQHVGMWFHHVWFSKTQHAAPYPGDEYMGLLIADSVATRHRIKETGFAPATPDWYCSYCLVQSKCPVAGDGTLAEVRQAFKDAPLEITRPDKEGK